MTVRVIKDRHLTYVLIQKNGYHLETPTTDQKTFQHWTISITAPVPGPDGAHQHASKTNQAPVEAACNASPLLCS